MHGNLPKGFVAVEGEAIIARSVERLRRAGLREFVFVVGWQAAAYRTWCAEQKLSAVCVDNVDFATTGSLRSLLLGAAVVPGRDLVIVESDLLYEQRAPELLLAAPEVDTVLISGFTGSGDEVWVHADATGRLKHMSKQRTPGLAPDGELVGLSRFSAALVGELEQAAKTLPASAHYEDGLNAVAPQRPVGLLKVPDLAWCEIDDPTHLQRARALVWPRIVAAEAARPTSR